jgi:tRNA pseudouridine32 synthase/23S rRNA pseudouridine746 synthase
VNWVELRASGTLYEDDAILVLDKPVGWSVMGERHDTDLVRLAADAGEKLWPAHRIDKVTSGVVLFAKDLAHHGDLTRQFNQRTVEKTYLALTATTGLPERGRIELPLSLGRKNRVRIAAPRESIVRDGDVWSVPDDAVLDGVRTYPSTTTFSRLGEADGTTLLTVHPETGRRHQIRVHLAWIGHAIVGDPLFDKHPSTRTGLHARSLTFDAPDGQRLTVTAEPDDEFRALGGSAL